jgi:hypothetical protein
LSGAHRLSTAELSTKAKTSGEEYLKEVADEFSPEHLVNEGSAEDNAQSSDKEIKVDNIGK